VIQVLGMRKGDASREPCPSRSTGLGIFYLQYLMLFCNFKGKEIIIENIWYTGASFDTKMNTEKHTQHLDCNSSSNDLEK